MEKSKRESEIVCVGGWSFTYVCTAKTNEEKKMITKARAMRVYESGLDVMCERMGHMRDLFLSLPLLLARSRG